MSLAIKEGNYLALGATVAKNQVTFTFEGEKEDVCRIVLISKVTGEQEVVTAPAEYCLGSMRSVTVSGFHPQEYNYIYEINGEKVVDPYARSIVGREVWDDASRDGQDAVVCGFSTDNFAWGEDKQPEIPKGQMVMYKLHVRGFTMGNKTAGKSKGTFTAVKNKIPYLKELGITTVELMPIYEFEEKPVKQALQAVPDYVKRSAENAVAAPVVLDKEEKRVNYWGYGKGDYFAVKASYAYEPQKASVEFKKLVKALHENGMECVLEMFFPETVPHGRILDVLHYWVQEYHVDGFHILGGSLPMTAIVQDPVLSRTKLFAADFAGMESGRKYKNLYVYREEYQYPTRQMLNHHPCDIREFTNQQKKQSEQMGYVNFIASNNGFTLADLFMYNDKHNEANGENNRDGSDYNLSNNYGVEGPSKKRHINEMRRQRVYTAYMMLLFAQGVPMIMAGDEMGNTQEGNNNAYCQDNEIGWVSWNQFNATKEQRELLKALISFRKQHGMIAYEKPFKFNDYRSFGMPDLSYHGEYAWLSQLDPGRKSIGMLYNGAYAEGSQDKSDIYVGYNFYADEVQLALPKLVCGKKEKKQWYLCMDSSAKQVVLEKEQPLEEQQYVTLQPHSICVVQSRIEK